MRSLRMVLGVGVFVALFIAAFKLVPVYMTEFEFEDAIKEEAKLAVYSNRSEDQIHEVMMKKARELDIPLRPEQLVVKHVGDDLMISADYVVHVDIPAFPVDLKFHPETKGHRLTGVASARRRALSAV